MKNKLLGSLSAVLFILASLVTCSASFLTFHQPKVPKSLKK
ncbi:MAG: cyclic lactone autoinducer peptide [Clostridia bacterium]|nr:cyclic lactone autoinducer peptide [Clostridia bacterium]